MRYDPIATLKFLLSDKNVVGVCFFLCLFYYEFFKISHMDGVQPFLLFFFEMFKEKYIYIYDNSINVSIKEETGCSKYREPIQAPTDRFSSVICQPSYTGIIGIFSSTFILILFIY